MKYIAKNIAAIIGAAPVSWSEKVPIEYISLDSRQIVFPKKSIFFALQGQRHDGHEYLLDAYYKGIRNFVVAKGHKIPTLDSANIFIVDSPLKALQQLARYHRGLFNLPVIGITGSNGKTIVKEWLFQLLATDYDIVRSPKSYNSQIGVPLSILQIASNHQLGIFEAGISKKNEMATLAPIIDCKIGMLTHIGDAHREGFPSQKEKVLQKLKLFAKAKKLVYQSDDNEVNQHIRTALPEVGHFNWSKNETGILKNIRWEKVTYGSTLSGNFNETDFQFSIPFQDDASCTNCVHCLSVMLLFGYSLEEAGHRLQALEAVEMRLELKAGINSCTLINDAYNADLASLNIALQFLEQQSPENKRTLILSDLLETGKNPVALYQKVAALILAKQIARFIGIGKEVSLIQKYLPATMETFFFANTESFIADFEVSAFNRETILLKGARHFAFEKIAQLLALQAHNTVLEINLNALRHNLDVFHKRLQPTTKMLVMVKAAAYGSGSYEIARMLEFNQVDYLGVAYADEGIALRKAGITLPILVLNPEVSAFQSMKRYQLEPEIFSLSILASWIKAGITENTPGIHIKLETGMNRLGFQAKDLETLIEIIKQNPTIKICSAFSHLAASESEAYDHFTHEQARRFEDMVQQLQKGLSIIIDRHLLNSSGIARLPEYHYEMVRLGIGIYGQEPSGQIQEALVPVFSLKARLSQIKEVAAGESIGYGRMGQAKQLSRIGIVSIGYADGLLRLAGNGRYKLRIQSKEAAIIGNVCMDMCMVDLNQIPEAKTGDEVLVFGPGKPVNLLAKALNTISYEVFTNISERVKRVYIQE